MTTLAEILKTDDNAILYANGKQLSYDEYYIVLEDCQDLTDKQIDIVLEYPFYVGTNLQEALNELGKPRTESLLD